MNASANYQYLKEFSNIMSSVYLILNCSSLHMITHLLYDWENHKSVYINFHCNANLKLTTNWPALSQSQ